MQLTHHTTPFTERIFPITIVCDNVTNAPNLGSLFRIADAFGVEKIIFCGDNIPLGRKMIKTSRATEKVVNYDVRASLLKVISEFKKSKHQLIALEITSESKSIYNYKFTINTPIVLIIGHENFGISEIVLDKCDDVIHIDMFGQNSSMNVVQATNIALYEITKQFLANN